MKFFGTLLILFSLALLAGCSTTAKHSGNGAAYRGRPVFLETPSPTMQLRRPQLAAVLEANGFTVTTATNALRCRASFAGFTHMFATIELLDGTNALVSVESANKGGGTWHDHSGTESALLDRTLKKFSETLALWLVNAPALR